MENTIILVIDKSEPIMHKFVDLEKIIHQENPSLHRKLKRHFLPLFPLLRLLLKEKSFNQSLHRFANRDIAFVRDMLKQELDVTWSVHGEDNIDPNTRYIFVSNHSHGGVDGLLFLAAVSQIFPKVKIVVNRVLTSIEKLDGVFLPFNVFSKPTREQYRELQNYLASSNPLLIFPAGVVSRKAIRKNRSEYNSLVERKWKKSFIEMAIKFKRDVVPTYIDIENSFWFYTLSNLRKRFKIKSNLEMFLLPREFYKFKSRHVNICYSKPIPHSWIVEKLKERAPGKLAVDVQNLVMSKFKLNALGENDIKK